MKKKIFKYSVNPHTKQKYIIPKIKDDKVNIKKFLEKNLKKPLIVVQGLGFVGAVMSLICANAKKKYAVIGVDQALVSSYWRIASINNGVFPLIAEDPKIYEYYKKSRKKNNFFATYDSYAYSFADVIIIDINLDIKKNKKNIKSSKWYDLDLNNFKKAIKTIGSHCKENALILLETTVPPGTCKKIVMPIIKEELLKRGMSVKKIKIGHSYERVMPGANYIDSVKSYHKVYAGIDKKSEKAVEKFLKTIIDTKNYPLTLLNNTNESELAKVLENSYRAMNIAFVAEWARFAEKAEINLFSTINAIKKRPSHSNLMFPGLGVGGYCLTKDPLLAAWSLNNIFHQKSKLKFSEYAVITNDNMPKYAYNFLIENLGKIKNKKILLLGIAYKSDIADTRSSPVSLFYDLIKKETSFIDLHDPYVSFWDEKNKKIEQSIEISLSKKYDVIIFTTAHTFYKKRKILTFLSQMKNSIIYDTVGIFNDLQLKQLQKNHKVIILGRGDI